MRNGEEMRKVEGMFASEEVYQSHESPYLILAQTKVAWEWKKRESVHTCNKRYPSEVHKKQRKHTKFGELGD